MNANPWNLGFFPVVPGVPVAPGLPGLPGDPPRAGESLFFTPCWVVVRTRWSVPPPRGGLLLLTLPGVPGVPGDPGRPGPPGGIQGS